VTDEGCLLDPAQVATLQALTAGASTDDLSFAGFVRLFAVTSTTYLQDIRAAAAAGDPGRLAHAAHTLKGAALQVGARRLGALAQQLDHAARDGNWRREDVDALVGVVADTHAALQAACAGGDASVR